ncbi:YiaA/YiaB family inner membrane protein [Herpetosiphon sp. NSE202]|uniref:YiaA/YiaB family inner membrane protein n=1 Tax=Herpetosiphon sp. NSE202 TaxID=3351349 RepID=UPI003640A0AB
MNHPTIQKDTGAWIAFTWISFFISIAALILGIYHAPVDIWVKSFLAVAALFAVGSTFTLAKTIRDNSEAGKMLNRYADAKTEQIISNYEFSSAPRNV